MLSLSHENSYYQVRIPALESTSGESYIALGVPNKRPRSGIIQWDLLHSKSVM